MQLEKIQNNAPRIPELVMQSLLSAIDSGEIKLNEDLLPERELSEMLGVSRGSLRECLAVLEFLGIIQSKGNRKVVVKTTDYIQKAIALIRLSDKKDMVADFIEFRRAVESAIAQHACDRATEEDLRLIGDCVDRVIQDPSDITADVDFHLNLANASHNPMFAAVINLVNSMIMDSRIRFLSLPDYYVKTVESHRNILLAIVNRDKEQVRISMDKHFDYIEEFAVEEFSKQNSDEQPGDVT